VGYFHWNIPLRLAVSNCQTIVCESTSPPTYCHELVVGWFDVVGVVEASGSDGDSGHGSSNCGSTAVMAGRGSGVAEVTMMRVAATATFVEVNLYPLFPLAMVR
jgi:hypothetical protein